MMQLKKNFYKIVLKKNYVVTEKEKHFVSTVAVVDCVAILKEMITVLIAKVLKFVSMTNKNIIAGFVIKKFIVDMDYQNINALNANF